MVYAYRNLMAFALMMGAMFASSVVAQKAGELNQGGMDLHLFRPPVDSKGLLSLNGSDVLGANDLSFGLILDGGIGLLPFEGFRNESSLSADCASLDPMVRSACMTASNSGDLRTGRLVDNIFTGVIHFNYGFENLFIVGVQLPITFGSGPSISVPGFYNEPAQGDPKGLNYQGVGNLTLHGKMRFLRAERNGGIGFAAALRLELPTGNAKAFAYDSDFALWPDLIFEWKPNRLFRTVLNAGVRVPFGKPVTNFPLAGRTVPSGTTASMPMLVSGVGSQIDYGPLLTFGAGLGVRLGNTPVDLSAEVYGSQLLGEFGTQGALSLEALGGLKIFVDRNSYLVLAGGGAIPIGGFQSADIRGMAGFIFEPSIGDRDGDGLKDDIDKCPDDPEDYDNFEDEDGCPEPDNDRDGILDVDDSCPMIPEDHDGDQDEDGCPEGNEGDRDGDGILDHEDQCPDEAEDIDQFEDEDGCPDPDNDKDGILDEDDLCPNDPEDKDGFEDEDGCPDPDNDHDRILDGPDACDNDPETYNGTDDEDGCPDTGITEIEGNNIRILQQIYFATDSAEILPESYPVVDAVAATLLGNPQFTLVEIQGHADERGDDEYNIRLTRDRAASVLEALTQRGVPRNRLRSGGYGELCPVDPRHNAPAWDKNRRVEFKIIRTVDGPTNVEVACPAGRRLIPQ